MIQAELNLTCKSSVACSSESTPDDTSRAKPDMQELSRLQPGEHAPRMTQAELNQTCKSSAACSSHQNGTETVPPSFP